MVPCWLWHLTYSIFFSADPIRTDSGSAFSIPNKPFQSACTLPPSTPCDVAGTSDAVSHKKPSVLPPFPAPLVSSCAVCSVLFRPTNRRLSFRRSSECELPLSRSSPSVFGREMLPPEFLWSRKVSWFLKVPETGSTCNLI